MAKIDQRTRENLGKNIQRLRKDLHITQEEMAERVKLSRTHMGHIEQGRKAPSLEVLERVARVFKVKVKDLFP